MQLISADPRSLKENPDKLRQSKSTPQSDALLCASIRAVGVVQPPVVKLDPDGGNGYIIVFGHRRTAQAIAADLAEIPLLLAEPSDDLGAMQSFAENIAREPLLGSVSQLSFWFVSLSFVGCRLVGHFGEGTSDVRVKRSRSEARTMLEAAASPQAFDGVQDKSCTPATRRAGEREGNPSH